MFGSLIRRKTGPSVEQDDAAFDSTTFSLSTAVPRPCERRNDERILPVLRVAKLVAPAGEQLIRVYGSTAVNTGYYTFSYIKDGETKTLPARYSFTFVKEGEHWMIVDHHSSAMPALPR